MQFGHPTHATGRPRKAGGGWYLCRPKSWGWTTTCYADCKNCLKILKKKGRAAFNVFLSGDLEMER